MDNPDFLGRGWAYPLQIDLEGQTAELQMSDSKQNIEESIQIILTTTRGERVMRPDFGCDLNQIVFESAHESTAGMIEFYVTEALKEFEPRIDLEEVSAEVDPEEEGKMLIHIEYTIKNLNSSENMVFPFYLEANR